MSSVDILADLGPSAEARAVARVLSAAAAPPWPHELRGYEAARRAFESAGAASPVRHGGRARRGAAAGVGVGAGGAEAGAGVRAVLPVRRLISVKLAAVAGALTVTGVAVAAEADVLPSPIQRAAHQVLGGVGVPDPDPESRGGQTMASSPGGPGGAPGSTSGQQLSPNSQGTDQGAGGKPSSAGLLPGTPDGTADTPGQSASTQAADVLALCRAYTAHQGSGDTNANGDGNANGGNGGLSNKDRRRLAALAGGDDKIGDFCAQVLAAASSAPIPQPTGAGTTAPASSSVSPEPSGSHDHKPDSSATTSPAWQPAASSSDPQNGGGDGHGHSTDPTHRGR